MNDEADEAARRWALQIEGIRLSLKKASRLPEGTAPAEALRGTALELLHQILGPGTAAKAAATICDWQDSGFNVVPSDVLQAIRCLAREKPLTSSAEVLRSDWGPEWRRFADRSLLELGYPPLQPTGFPGTSGELVDPAAGPLHRWIAFRYAYSLTRAERINAAWEQIQQFDVPPLPTAPVDMEVLNLHAYLMLIRSGYRELDQAICLLERISQSPVAEDNLSLLRKRKQTVPGERPPIGNPYLALKVDHGAPREEWWKAYASIRTSRDASPGTITAANAAHDQIRAIERDSPGSDVYVLPLNEQFIAGTSVDEAAQYVRGQTKAEAGTAEDPIDTLKVNALKALLKLATINTRGLPDGR